MKKNKKTIKRDSNLREKKRVDTVQRVSYRTNSSIRGEGFSQNLSENGCCLFLNEEVPIGSLIEITFDRLGSNSNGVRVIGRVIWQKDFLSGIKFLPDIKV
ncbi:MAG: PilZ domain-containing protein [Candidatus Aminicenantes bacterium]|nr:PilZ domain-containing protein [Candidatus Aminicenantes bacterium]HHF51917.1 PilZ domain-containing protein [Candidatus Aminicenantes bacterium]